MSQNTFQWSHWRKFDKTPLFLNLVNFNLAIQSLAKKKLCNHYDVNLMIDSGSLQSSIQPFPYVTLLTTLHDIFCCRRSATVLRCTSCQCRWSPFFMTAVPTTARTCCHGYRRMSPSTFCPSWIQVGLYGSCHCWFVCVFFYHWFDPMQPWVKTSFWILW